MPIEALASCIAFGRPTLPPSMASGSQRRSAAGNGSNAGRSNPHEDAIGVARGNETLDLANLPTTPCPCSGQSTADAVERSGAPRIMDPRERRGYWAPGGSRASNLWTPDGVGCGGRAPMWGVLGIRRLPHAGHGNSLKGGRRGIRKTALTTMAAYRRVPRIRREGEPLRQPFARRAGARFLARMPQSGAG